MQQPSSNGIQPASRDLTVKWVESHQDVALEFNNQEFRRWEFVIAVLKMATEKAENALKVSRMQEMAAQQQSAMEQAMVEQQLQQAMQQGKGKLLHG